MYFQQQAQRKQQAQEQVVGALHTPGAHELQPELFE